MYQSNDLVELAYECYYEQEFSNTSYILNLIDEPSYALEALGNSYSLKDKLVAVMDKAVDIVAKLLKIAPGVNEVTISDPARIKAMTQFINHYQEIYNYGNSLIQLGNLAQIVYRNKDTDNESRLKEITDTLTTNRGIIEDNPDNLPQTLMIKFSDVAGKLNRIYRFYIKVRDITKGLPESSSTNMQYNHIYTEFRHRATFFNVIICNVAATLHGSLFTKGETQLLNFKKLGTMNGTNVISGRVKGKVAFTYIPTKQEVIDKWGKVFIVVNEDIYSKLSSNAQKFLREHEYAHVELINMNEDENLKGAEKEFHCDEVAYEKMGKRVDVCVKAIQEIIKASSKIDPLASSKYAAIGSIRMKNLQNLSRSGDSAGRLKTEKKEKSNDVDMDIDNLLSGKESKPKEDKKPSKDIDFDIDASLEDV